MVVKNLLLSFLFFSFSAFVIAEDEIDAWYLSKGGDYLVQESTKGNLFALLTRSKGGEIRIYFTMSDASCEKSDGKIIPHNPLSIDGKLVRFSQYCEPETQTRVFYPSSDEGAKYLLGEFKGKKFVNVMIHDGSYTFIFSAKNFSDVYSAYALESSGI